MQPLTLEQHRQLGKGKIGERYVGFIADIRATWEGNYFIALVVHNDRSELTKRKGFEPHGNLELNFNKD